MRRRPDTGKQLANYTGAVRFPDGELRYFVFVGSADTARPTLFTRESDADASWHNTQAGVPRHQARHGDELVEVMPYYCHGSRAVAFMSTANREASLITGVLSLDEAMQEQDDQAA